MVALIDGVVKLVPVCKDDPPVELIYQLITPALGVASNVNIPASHFDKGVILDTIGGLQSLYKLEMSD